MADDAPNADGDHRGRAAVGGDGHCRDCGGVGVTVTMGGEVGPSPIPGRRWCGGGGGSSMADGAPGDEGDRQRRAAPGGDGHRRGRGGVRAAVTSTRSIFAAKVDSAMLLLLLSQHCATAVHAKCH